MKTSRILAVIACLALTIPAAPAEADGWDFSLTPYLWALGLDGTLGIGTNGTDPVIVDFDVSFSDIWDNLEMAVPLHFEMKAPVWTLIAEVNYAGIGQDLGTIPGTSDVDTLIAELLAGWQWKETVEILFGSRYYDYSTEINIAPPVPLAEEQRFKGGTSWVDPVVGIRYGGQLNRRGTWHSAFRADVGGFGLGSDLTWNVRLGLGWDMTYSSRLVFGYHWLDIDYDDNGFLFDVLQQGPEVGIRFSW